MVAHQQQGFPCICAKQTVGHKSQTAGQWAGNEELWDPTCLFILNTLSETQLVFAFGFSTFQAKLYNKHTYNYNKQPPFTRRKQ